MSIAGISVVTLLLVVVAGIGAGFVGYAVGASSLVSYPALLALGVPPVLANTTNTVGVVGTGVGGCISARRELHGHRARVILYAIIGVVGGVLGGVLLLELPAVVFEYLVPPLILFSALIIAVNPRGRAQARDAVGAALGPDSVQAREAAAHEAGQAFPRDDIRRDPWWMWLGIDFVGVYSGYFGAGAGTLALAMLDLGHIGSFHEINALKTVVGFGANITASVMFIVRGSVNWPFAIALCIGCFIGSYIAPPITRHIPANIMRAAAVLAGVILAVKLGWSTYL
ncbi:sulfite exporter TauE/SafE family protein [Bifidobacterium leontopitheci]|uniref:Probable membrane transporter protein n=1 Tax=Bifidobacterium leontopitheci TaxID=2650774 RepID=A0A6I1GKW9_9BIFI|nr:sulfite exporter TauE/SafE family protein [Bifidobacterium leontopitheci]KAB7790286.1 permease [Bifidobacterium leontopitheci]